jgi:hypothetical protein
VSRILWIIPGSASLLHSRDEFCRGQHICPQILVQLYSNHQTSGFSSFLQTRDARPLLRVLQLLGYESLHALLVVFTRSKWTQKGPAPKVGHFFMYLLSDFVSEPDEAFGLIRLIINTYPPHPPDSGVTIIAPCPSGNS